MRACAVEPPLFVSITLSGVQVHCITLAASDPDPACSPSLASGRCCACAKIMQISSTCQYFTTIIYANYIAKDFRSLRNGCYMTGFILLLAKGLLLLKISANVFFICKFFFSSAQENFCHF